MDEIERTKDIVSRAQQFYEKVRDTLEANAMGRYLCISADTGDYVVGDSIREVRTAFHEQFGSDTPAWLTQVGNPDHVWSRTRIFQQPASAPA